MRQPAERGEAFAQALARHAGCARKRAGGERVGDVVRAVDRQRARLDQRLRAFDEHAAPQAVVLSGGRIEAEADHARPGDIDAAYRRSVGVLRNGANGPAGEREAQEGPEEQRDGGGHEEGERARFGEVEP